MFFPVDSHFPFTLKPIGEEGRAVFDSDTMKCTPDMSGMGESSSSSPSPYSDVYSPPSPPSWALPPQSTLKQAEKV